MVMMAKPLAAALRAIRDEDKRCQEAPLIYLSPQGSLLDQGGGGRPGWLQAVDLAGRQVQRGR